MSVNTPLFEATQSAAKAINGLQRSLFIVKPLAMVFPASASTGVSARVGEDAQKQYFPPSLSSVIYAIFHRTDDPEYFNAVNKSVASATHNKERYSYDPESQVLMPNMSVGDGGVAERLNKAREFAHEPELTSTNIDEASDIVAQFLITPSLLTEDVGKTFETDLIDTMEYAAPQGTDEALLDRFGKIKKNAYAEYVKGLMFKWDLPDGTRVVPDPERAKKISGEELAAFIACRISEHFADDVFESAEAIEKAGEPLADKRGLQDVLAYTTEWVTDNGHIPQEREVRTGDKATDYVPLNVNERNDLIKASVAPESIIPLFAKDCRRFETKDMSPEAAQFGYAVIARAIGATGPDPDEINNFIETKLVPDTQVAKAIRQRAIKFVMEHLMASQDDSARSIGARILRHVFQYRNDELYSGIPGISGSGDEIRHRRTGVAIGNISSKITDVFKPSSGKYMVIADENPGTQGKSDEFTVDIDGIQKTVSRSDSETIHNYERPALVGFYDSESSYPVYAIWKGIVPYSKVVDNHTMYDISQDPETVAAREDSGEGLVKGAMQSVSNRATMNALGADVPPAEKTLTHDDIVGIADAIGQLDGRYRQAINSKSVQALDDANLRNYLMATAVNFYNGLLSSFDSAQAEYEDSFAFKDAFMTVMGDPETMMTPMSPDEVIKKISVRYTELASAREVANGDEGAIDGITDAYLTKFFDWIDNEDVPQVLQDTYGNDERTIATNLKAYVKDLLDSVKKVASGYGYNGLRMLNTYHGGRYSFNNRLSLAGASYDKPIGDFGDTKKTREVRETIINNVVNPVAKALHVAVSNKQNAVEMLKAIETSAKGGKLVDSGVMDESIKSAMSVCGGYDEATAIAYGILRGAISGNCLTRKLVQVIDDGNRKAGVVGIKPAISGETIERNLENLKSRAANMNGLFGKSLRMLGYIQELSNGGEDFKPIRDVAGDANSERTRMTYGLLMSAVDACRKTAERVGGLEQDVLKSGFVDVGMRQNAGNDVDLSKTAGEDELAKVAAVEDTDSNISDSIESELNEWEPANGYNTYHGLTGYTGFDTIRVGDAGDTEMANSLANPETVAQGINRYGVAICARVIDDARNHYNRLVENGEKGEFAITSRNVTAWADKIVTYAAKYMLANIALERKTFDGSHAINPAAGTEWTETARTVLSEITRMCKDNVPDGAASIADEILQMNDNLEVSSKSMESISAVSTAMAHLILKLGEVSNKEQIGDPLGGQADSRVGIPDEVKRLAAVRAMPDDTKRGQMSHVDSKEATKLLADAGKSLSGNSDLAKLLSNLYVTYGRDTTEGYASALGDMNAAAHAAGNKTDRAKTELKGGVAPTKLAADLYKLVWDAEDEGDRSYSNILEVISRLGDEDNPVLLGEVIGDAGLNDTVKIGAAKGKTYAGYAFGDSKELELPVEELPEHAPDAGRKLALALRMQMVDRLLGDRTFSSFRENDELWEKFSTRVSQQAMDLDGTSSAFLFVTLDHAILNLGREVRQKGLFKRVNADTALSEEYAAEQRIKDSTGVGADSKIDAAKLSTALLRYLFSSSTDTRKQGLAEIKFILGDRPTEAFVDSIDADEIRKNTSVAQRKRLCHDMAMQLSRTYGQTAKQIMNGGKANDETFKKDVNTLRTALRVVATGKPDSNGHTAEDYANTIVPGILGDSLSEAFLSTFKESVPNGGKINEHTLDMLISKFIDANLHSRNAVVTKLMKNANMDVDVTPSVDGRGGDSAAVAETKNNGLKSNVARWNAGRETGGVAGRGTFVAENDVIQDNAKKYVESELAKFDVNTEERGDITQLYRRLNQLGFRGSIEEFCEKVKSGDESQATVAHQFAFDDDNYQPAMFQKVTGSFSALTPTKATADENLVTDVARGMERLGLSGITMVKDRNGDETPFVKFSNASEPRSISSGYASRQLEILMDKFKEVYGEDFTDKDGQTTDDKIRKLDKLMQETSTRYPVDPVANSRELVPMVLSIINNDKYTNSQPWAKAIGGVNGHHIYEKEIDRKGKHFVVNVSEDVIVSIVRSMVRDGSGDIKASDIAKELDQLRKFKRKEVNGVITKLADTVKANIDKRVENLIKTMVKNGNTTLAGKGIKVVWTNPPKAPAPNDNTPDANA